MKIKSISTVDQRTQYVIDNLKKQLIIDNNRQQLSCLMLLSMEGHEKDFFQAVLTGG